MSADLERRLVARTPLRLPAKLLISHERPFEVEVVDLSVGGVCVLAQRPLPLDSACAIAFEVQTPKGMRRINAWGAVVYESPAFESAQRRIGIAFVDMDVHSRHFLQHLGSGM